MRKKVFKKVNKLKRSTNISINSKNVIIKIQNWLAKLNRL